MNHFLKCVALFLCIIGPTLAQPQLWSDVCTPNLKGPGNLCYLWTGAPFPFSDLGSFLINPLCVSPCTIFISPFVLSCAPSTSAPACSLQDYQSHNCTLNVNCSGGDSDTFLNTIQTRLQPIMTALYPTGVPLIGDPVRWDGPLTIAQNDLTIASMWGNNSPQVTVQSFSPRLINNPLPNCNLVAVTGNNLTMKNINFQIDPYCVNYLPTAATIVVTGTGLTLTNVQSSPSPFPLVLVQGGYKEMSIVLTDVFYGPPVPPSPSPSPAITAGPYTVVLLEVAGTVVYDSTSSVLFFGTATSDSSLKPTFINTSSLTNIDPTLRGCAVTITTNAYCDQKNTEDTILLAITSTLFGLLVLVFLVHIRRAHQNTLANQLLETREMQMKKSE